MNILSEKVKALAESETLAMAKKTQELREAGVDVINLTLGEPDFFVPDEIKEAAKDSIDGNYSFYSPVAGFKDVREGIASKLTKENKLDVKFDQVVISTGAKQAIANLLLAVLNPGDEVILPAPYWVSYKDMVEFLGGKVVEIKTTLENDFKITPAQLEKAMTQKSKLFLFSNPCNPSGTVYNPSELRSLATVFEKAPHVLIASDEIYEYITFLPEYLSIGAIDSIKDRVVTINGFSKSFAMTGWRLGYLAGPKNIADACAKVQSQFTSGANATAQRAALAALEVGKAGVQSMVAEFKKRRDYLMGLMKEVPGIKFNKPDGAFYLFPEVKSFYGKKYKDRVINNSKDLCMYLLEEAHVGLTPGFAFGAPDNIRLSYAVKEDTLKKAVERIKKALGELK